MSSVLSRLYSLLTARNLNYLDHILWLLTDPTSSVFSLFWSGFAQSFTNPQDQKLSWAALKSLKRILHDYRKGS